MDPRSKKQFVADFDFEVDRKHKTVSITEQGVARRALPRHRPPLSGGERHLVNHLIQSLALRRCTSATSTTP